MTGRRDVQWKRRNAKRRRSRANWRRVAFVSLVSSRMKNLEDGWVHVLKGVLFADGLNNGGEWP